MPFLYPSRLLPKLELGAARHGAYNGPGARLANTVADHASLMSAGTDQGALSAPSEPEPRGWRWALKAALPFVFLGLILAGPFQNVWTRWMNPEDYYSHGPLIPFVAAYLVLRKRKALTGEEAPGNGPLIAGAIGAGVLYFLFSDLGGDMRVLFALVCAATAAYLVYCLRTLKPEPWKPGLFVLVPSLVFCVIAGSHEIVSIGWFFSLLVIVGLVLYYLGKRIALALAFPLFFLFTSAPLPEYKIQEIALPMRERATAAAVRVLSSKAVGVYCERRGTWIVFPGESAAEQKQISVGAPCSGVRSLIAFTTFGLLFAYIVSLSRISKALLFAATIPAAFVANVIRILVLALVTYRWDADTATGMKLYDHMQSGALASLVPHLKHVSDKPVHDATGYLVYAVGFVALFGLERVLTLTERRIRRRRAGPEAEQAAEGGDG